MSQNRGDVADLTFRIADSAGEPADPDAVSLDVERPDGTHLSREYGGEDGELVREEAGVYSFRLELTQEGVWNYRFEATGAVQDVAEGSVVVGEAEDPSTPSARLVTLAAFRPPPREDGVAWSKARIDGTNAPNGEDGWIEVATKDIEPLDADPRTPGLRGFSVSTSYRWLRLTFLDASSNASEPSCRVFGDGDQFRPSVAEIASILRARTYSKGRVDPDQPMAALSGGNLLGEFTENTQPTAAQVEREITKACTDVARRTGRVPGELLEKTRGVAAVKAAAEVERSYIPTQTEDARSIFQTLRMSGDEELDQLAGTVQWWVLANRPVARGNASYWWWCW